ncbi:hypothetical protein V6N13_092875 [Hibiscus sabdariffa]
MLLNGFWTTFAHLGDVVDAFIPMKKRKYGKMVDAQSAISRLDGFVIYRSRIMVSLARYNNVVEGIADKVALDTLRFSISCTTVKRYDVDKLTAIF